MFSSIVVGTDGSPTAEAAVQHAAELARTCGAKLHIVSAYRPIESLYTAPDLIPVDVRGAIDPRKDAEQVVTESAAKVRAAGIEVEGYACPGDPASALIEVAETAKADLLVVGNRGMTSKARFLLGSVPNKVSHHAPCSVLIVKTTG